MAAGAVTLRRPPMPQNIRSNPTRRLPAKAATITSGRVVRSMVIPCAVSEAGRDAGRNHFEEYSSPVVEPKPDGTEQGQHAEAGTAPGDCHGHPALAPGRDQHR